MFSCSCCSWPQSPGHIKQVSLQTRMWSFFFLWRSCGSLYSREEGGVERECLRWRKHLRGSCEKLELQQQIQTPEGQTQRNETLPLEQQRLWLVEIIWLLCYGHLSDYSEHLRLTKPLLWGKDICYSFVSCLYVVSLLSFILISQTSHLPWQPKTFKSTQESTNAPHTDLLLRVPTLSTEVWR